MKSQLTAPRCWCPLLRGLARRRRRSSLVTVNATDPARPSIARLPLKRHHHHHHSTPSNTTTATAAATSVGGSDDAAAIAALVLGGCHSLMAVNGTLVGDPLEVSALGGVGWAYNATSCVAQGGAGGGGGPRVHIWHRYEFASRLQRCEELPRSARAAPPLCPRRV